MDDFDKMFGEPVKEQKQQAKLFEATEPVQAKRIRDGNIKLGERWLVIKSMKEGTGKDSYLASWDEAKERLLRLCGELIAMGYTKCLYLNEKPKFVCLACPVKDFQPGKCPAWSIDI